MFFIFGSDILSSLVILIVLLVVLFLVLFTPVGIFVIFGLLLWWALRSPVKPEE